MAKTEKEIWIDIKYGIPKPRPFTITIAGEVVARGDDYDRLTASNKYELETERKSSGWDTLPQVVKALEDLNKPKT
jgi:hypothetical protein